MANTWFRLYAEFANDPKVQMMSEADQRRYVMLMCIRRADSESVLSDAEVAFMMRISEESAEETRITFCSAGLIHGGWELVEPLETTGDRPLSHVWKSIRDRIFKRDNYTCQYCGRRGVKLECDHVFPVSRGGGHGDENLLTACFECNRSKLNKTVEEWRGA